AFAVAMQNQFPVSKRGVENAPDQAHGVLPCQGKPPRGAHHIGRGAGRSQGRKRTEDKGPRAATKPDQSAEAIWSPGAAIVTCRGSLLPSSQTDGPGGNDRAVVRLHAAR